MHFSMTNILKGTYTNTYWNICVQEYALTVHLYKVNREFAYYLR